MTRDKCCLKCFEYSGNVNRLNVVINGIPTAAEIEDLYDAAEGLFNQLDITEYLHVPDVKPDMEQINFVNLKVCLKDAWLSPSGNKILIKGVIWQKVMYTACRSDQPVHTVEKEIPFSHFIDITDDPSGGHRGGQGGNGGHGGNGGLLPQFIVQNLEQYIVLAPEDAFVELENGRTAFKNVIVTAFLLLPDDPGQGGGGGPRPAEG